MIAGTAAAAQIPWMWLVSRSSGLALLVLFSAVFILGIVARVGTTPGRVGRFVSVEVHRTLALFSVALLGLHVATAILDPYVSIGWWASVLPFTSSYRPLAIGLGALVVDIGAAIILTSVFRRRIGYGAWRAVHWLAYLAWPVAFLHSISAGNDMGIWWVAALVWGSATAVALAVGVRVHDALRGRTPRRPAPVRSLSAVSPSRPW